MKKLQVLTMTALAGVMMSCSTNDGWDDYNDYVNNTQVLPGNNAPNSGTTVGTTALGGTLATFDVTVNTDPIDETETLPSSSDTYYEDYVETYTPTATIQIVYNGSSVTVIGEADGVLVNTDGGDVTVTSSSKNIAYELSGSTTDGSFKIYSEKKFELILNGVEITNPTGAAINNQGKRAYVVVRDGTENTLSDGATYTMVDGEDQKGTFFSEGKLAFSGRGKLSVYAIGKNGIVSDDYVFIRPNTNIYVKSTASNGIKSNDGIIIRGGVVNVEVTAAAAKGIKTDGIVLIEGGRVTAITSGDTEYDSDDMEYKGCAGISTDSIMVMKGGEVYVKSTGVGGKGIKVDQTLTMSDGVVNAIAAGNNLTDRTGSDSGVSAKAIKVDGDMTMDGGQIMARAAAHEAIESKGNLTVNAGSMGAYSSDDAINSAGNMVISGGYIYCYSTGNDGLDANGNLTINGGVVIACGTTSPEEGIDAAEGKTLSINGGTVIGIGGGSEATSGSQLKASPSGISVLGGAYLTVKDASGNNIFAFQVPRTYSNATLQVSSPKFTSGATYTLSTAASASGNNDFYGYIAEATVNNETQLGTFTTSTTTSGGMMGGGAAGGFPGGMGGGGGHPGGW